MPGLVTLRPLTSASKTGRNASTTTVTPTKPDKAWDDRFAQPAPRPGGRHANANARTLPVHVVTDFRSSQLHAFGPQVRLKQVADPLPDGVRARLCGSLEVEDADLAAFNYCSSGSEHDPSSVCLAAMVHEFMEEEDGPCGKFRCNCVNGVCNRFGVAADVDDSKSAVGGELAEIVQGLNSSASSSERTLFALVTAVMSEVKEEADPLCDVTDDNSTNGCLRRLVMRKLRASGFNAAICKSRWDHAGGFPGGDYEYIDILLEGHHGKGERMIVDLDFRGQFQIARPTSQYNAVMHQLPSVFVGKADRLQQLVSIMSDAAKRSLKKRGMHLPPWRKPEYMRAKWFSPYKRTTNEASLSRKSSDDDLGRDLGCIGMKDSKFTDEMEFPYRKSDAMFQLSQAPDGAVGRPPRGGYGRRFEQAVPQGANRSRTRDEDCITVMVTDWQPPTVLPRTSRRMERTGLATVLKEAGMTHARQ